MSTLVHTMNGKARNLFASLPAFASAAVLALALYAPAPGAQAAAIEVGSVSFVIGRVQVVAASGQVRTLAAGDPVHAGDTVVTAAAEHAHLRFTDGGFVSVRPGSRLSVEEYDTHPDSTAIRFKLEHGVVRSITGRAAQARKERFRLNTPVAAIGVRGTDFVVQADHDGVRAVVNQGAIVVAPFVGGCTQQSLGPCLTVDARELADDMGRVVLELTAMQPPRLRPIGGSGGGRGPDQSAPPAPQEPTAENPAVVALESVGMERALMAGRAPEGGATTPAVPLPPTATVPPPLELAPQEPTQLRWGRWGADARAGDTHSVDYASARAQGEITVGTSYVGLFRSAGDSPVLSTQLGQGTFKLFSGEVSLVNAAGAPSPGSVDGGWLKIDFAQRHFSTALSLSHPATGRVGLESAGAVRDDGVFVARDANGRVAGAVSFDGKEAAYLFDKLTAQGMLTGTTLWTR